MGRRGKNIRVEKRRGQVRLEDRPELAPSAINLIWVHGGLGLLEKGDNLGLPITGGRALRDDHIALFGFYERRLPPARPDVKIKDQVEDGWIGRRLENGTRAG